MTNASPPTALRELEIDGEHRRARESQADDRRPQGHGARGAGRMQTQVQALANTSSIAKAIAMEDQPEAYAQ